MIGKSLPYKRFSLDMTVLWACSSFGTALVRVFPQAIAYRMLDFNFYLYSKFPMTHFQKNWGLTDEDGSYFQNYSYNKVI